MKTIRVALAVAGVFAASPATTQEMGGVRLDAPSFVFARHATGSSSSLYATRGFGTIGGFVAMVHNPATAYSERIAGAYTRIRWNAQQMLVAASYAEASEAAYVQLYLMPELSHGPVVLSATVEWYEPLEQTGIRQLEVNPVAVVVRTVDALRVGAAYTVGVAGGRASHRAGPVVEAALPWGTLRAEVLRRGGAEAFELRTSVFAVF